MQIIDKTTQLPNKQNNPRSRLIFLISPLFSDIRFHQPLYPNPRSLFLFAERNKRGRRVYREAKDKSSCYL